MTNASRRLGLTRDQLAAFLKDHESIKQFEKLFETTSTIDTDVQNFATIDEVALAEGLLSEVTETVDALRKDVEGLQMAPVSNELSVLAYGNFYDTTTQTAAAINTAYAITFNTTDISRGVTRGSPTSRIIVDAEGVYNFQFSAQLDNTSGGNHLAFLWARVNGVDVVQSASQVRLKGTDGELVAAWNFALSLKAKDYFELMWSVNDVSVQLVAQAAAAPVPAIPSVILSVASIQGQSWR